MSDGTNKTLWYALSGAAVIIGGALVYHFLTDPESGGMLSSGGGETDKMIEEITALGPPARGANGMLTFNYYKELFLIVNKFTKKKNAPFKK